MGDENGYSLQRFISNQGRISCSCWLIWLLVGESLKYVQEQEIERGRKKRERERGEGGELYTPTVIKGVPHY